MRIGAIVLAATAITAALIANGRRTDPAAPAAAATDAPDFEAGAPAGAAGHRAATRARAQHTLPASGEGLASIYAALKSRAASGDREAATQLYDGVQQCAAVAERLRYLPGQLRYLRVLDTTQLNPEMLADFGERLRKTQELFERAQRDAADCAGLSETQLQVIPVMLRAAQLGDLDAAACYLDGSTMFMSPRLIDHPEWLTDYHEQALTIAQNAVDRGDWRVVGELQNAYAQQLTAGLLGQLTGPSPALAYRYLRLQRFGESDTKRQAQLDAQLALAAQTVSPADVSDGDAWAQSMYVHHFNATPASRTHSNCQY